MLSGNLDVLQKRLGVKQTKSWDAATRGALVAFQQSKSGPLPMSPSGHPDAATLINLGYYDPLDYMSRNQITYLEGGEQPSGFGRDVITAFNQVPRWAWLGVGGAFLLMAYVSYRKAYKKKKAAT